MVYYRLYQLRETTNEVTSFEEFEADGDSLAIAMAEVWRSFNPMELWSGRRKVRRWEAVPAQIGLNVE
jgi:hypothetical protein